MFLNEFDNFNSGSLNLVGQGSTFRQTQRPQRA